LKGKNVVLTSHGRAPWYTPDGKPIEAYVIGIAGGSASGKTSVARAILSALGYIPTVLILSQDAFYRAHTPEELELAFKSDLDLGDLLGEKILGNHLLQIIPTLSICTFLQKYATVLKASK